MDVRTEPTMEEILASIRRIIADERETAAEPSAPNGADSFQPVAIADEAEEVEDSEGERDEDEGKSENGEEEAAAPIEVDAVTADLPDADEPDPMPPATAAPPPERDVLELTQHAPVEALASAATVATSAQTLSTLSHLLVRGPEAGANTLEGLIREMLKPMLKDWLDQNLPLIVERLVAREVDRITGKGFPSR